MPEKPPQPIPPPPQTSPPPPPPKTSPAPPPPVTPPPQKGMSTGGKVAIGFGISCLVLILVGAVVGYILYKQAAKKVKEELNNFAPSKLEESLSNLPSVEEFDKTIKEIEEEASKSTEKTGQLNEALSDGEVEITVNSVGHLGSIGTNMPVTEGNEYVRINVKLKNETQKEITVFTSNFTLRDSNFDKYYVAYLEEGSLENLISAWQYIPADKEITGNIVFEAKKDITNLEVVYDGQAQLQFELGE